MNDWARNRKRLIFIIILFILVVVIALPGFLIFYRTPTCFDKKLNGDERGVDCGGSCQLLCKAESLPLLLRGDVRVLPVSDNAYELVALVENPNRDAEIARAAYVFKIYNATSSIPIKTIESETYVPRGSVFALFERPFVIDNGGVPKRATLEWKKETLSWKKNTKALPALSVKSTALSREDTAPRLEAQVENLSLEPIANIELVAILSDASGNVFAASSTFIDAVLSGETTQAVFTWPKPFTAVSASTDVSIRVFPDRSFIR